MQYDKSSPYDTRRENLIGRAYSRSGNLDSALYYFRYVNERKPLLYSMVEEICNISASKGDHGAAVKCISAYLGREKSNREAWRKASLVYESSGDFKKALTVTDSSLKYFPEDSLFLARRVSLERNVRLQGYEGIFRDGFALFKNKDYPGAARCFSEIISKVPDAAEAYEFRSKCYFALKQYANSVSDLNVLMALKKVDRSLYNLRGICLFNLRRNKEACGDFETGMKLGDPDAVVNFGKFCGQKVK